MICIKRCEFPYATVFVRLTRFDVIPGVLRKSVMLPDATESRHLSCIGDEEHIVNAVRGSGGGVFVIPTNPSVAVPLALKLSNCRVHFPDRSALDTKIRNALARSMAVSIGDQSSDVQVLSRSLKIGKYKSLDCYNFICYQLYSIVACFSPLLLFDVRSLSFLLLFLQGFITGTRLSVENGSRWP